MYYPAIVRFLKIGEPRCGEVLAAFDGRGTARVFEYDERTVLMERLDPATPLSRLVFEGRDAEATDILARVIGELPEVELDVPPVEAWGDSFPRYLDSGDPRIPRELVIRARDVYTSLCSTQTRRRLLHGDLHHDNVLFDTQRGWLAVDPKGVMGELEFELGAALRNPWDFSITPEMTNDRIARFSAALHLDAARIRAWGFAQSVLSAIWCIEDGNFDGKLRTIDLP